MSADRRDEFVDDRHDDRDPDPFNIVPDDFLKHWPQANSIREALEMAERATGAKDRDQFPRCPNCGSIRLRKKPGTPNMPHKIDTEFKCTGCGHHFDEPAPSREDERPGEQSTLPGVREK